MLTRNRPLIYIVLALGLLGAVIGGVLRRGNKPSAPGQAVPASGRKFCGPEGELTATQAIQSHRSYCVHVRSDLDHLVPGTPARLVFAIIDDRGETLRRFATVHEKVIHLILVRRDLQEFQHLHPVFNEATGEFTLDSLTFTSAGPFRLFADFTPAVAQLGPSGEPLGITSYMDVAVGDTTAFRAQELGAPELMQKVEGYSISVSGADRLEAGKESTLGFRIEQDRAPVKDLEPYLGALGHAVVLQEGELEFLHAHAVEQQASKQTGEIDFGVHFPMPGRYKVFFQFQHRGRVLTAAFVLPKVQGGNETAPQSHQGAH